MIIKCSKYLLININMIFNFLIPKKASLFNGSFSCNFVRAYFDC